MTYSYPTEECEIKSIIYEYLKDTAPDIIDEFELEPFIMKTQSLARTFIDKLFAICDYYMNEKATRNSRHLYDIYKLKPWIVADEQFYSRDYEHSRGNQELSISAIGQLSLAHVLEIRISANKKSPYFIL